MGLELSVFSYNIIAILHYLDHVIRNYGSRYMSHQNRFDLIACSSFRVLTSIRRTIFCSRYKKKLRVAFLLFFYFFIILLLLPMFNSNVDSCSLFPSSSQWRELQQRCSIPVSAQICRRGRYSR